MRADLVGVKAYEVFCFMVKSNWLYLTIRI